MYIFITSVQKIAVGRCVLYAASDYFKALFTVEMTEKDAKEVQLDEVNSTILQPLVDYCCTSKIVLSHMNAIDFLMAAHRYTKIE